MKLSSEVPLSEIELNIPRMFKKSTVNRILVIMRNLYIIIVSYIAILEPQKVSNATCGFPISSHDNSYHQLMTAFSKICY